MIIIIKVRQIRVNKLTQSLLRWFAVHTVADQHSEPIRIIILFWEKITLLRTYIFMLSCLMDKDLLQQQTPCNAFD